MVSTSGFELDDGGSIPSTRTTHKEPPFYEGAQSYRARDCYPNEAVVSTHHPLVLVVDDYGYDKVYTPDDGFVYPDELTENLGACFLTSTEDLEKALSESIACYGPSVGRLYSFTPEHLMSLGFPLPDREDMEIPDGEGVDPLPKRSNSSKKKSSKKNPPKMTREQALAWCKKDDSDFPSVLATSLPPLKKRPFSGQEASILAVIVQSKKLSPEDKRRILAALDGRALQVAKALLGQTKRPTKDILAAAEGFKAWGERLKARAAKTKKSGTALSHLTALVSSLKGVQLEGYPACKKALSAACKYLAKKKQDGQ